MNYCFTAHAALGSLSQDKGKARARTTLVADASILEVGLMDDMKELALVPGPMDDAIQGIG
jgi:hypothetical protein